MAVQRNLIIDVGMLEGNDSSFYMQKGFDVVGVEADPMIHQSLLARFEGEIGAGRLTLLNRAAADRSSTAIKLWRHSEPGHSSIVHRSDDPKASEHTVTSIDWTELVAIKGVPYYMKIDIEGAEPLFLSSLLGTVEIPTYISAELQNFQPVELFYKLGYRRFRMLNQMMFGHVAMPNPPLEGGYVPNPQRHHWSGPFGRELPGDRWFSFEEIREIYDTLHRLWTYRTLLVGWYDCHAWTGDESLTKLS